MNKLKNPSTFAFGLIVSTLIGLLIWYWYKATSAEDGALALLDRMAADAKNRDTAFPLKAESVANYITLEPNGDNLPPFLAVEKVSRASLAKTPEDLQQVKGIGPVFANKLQVAGIDTLAELTAVSPQRLAEILDISESRATNILTEAARL
ncbi:MAG: hypothetical protein IAF02_13145 [Anaerolineae bacterium]|nr:hypothetical protein [Anaerolineae bacterium]